MSAPLILVVGMGAPLVWKEYTTGGDSRRDAARQTATKTSPQRTQGAQRTQGKAQAGGCFFESKSSQAAKTFMISTLRVQINPSSASGVQFGWEHLSVEFRSHRNSLRSPASCGSRPTARPFVCKAASAQSRGRGPG